MDYPPDAGKRQIITGPVNRRKPSDTVRATLIRRRIGPAAGRPPQAAGFRTFGTAA